MSTTIREPDMVVIPAGEFWMGSRPGELMRDPQREAPLHRVVIAQSFAIGRFAVTVAEFEAFVEATGHPVPVRMMTGEDDVWRERPGRSFQNPGFSQAADHPVVGVIWDDAIAYASWLTRRTGKPYRLPSEAEWEYTARAGTTTAFWWGDTISPDAANYNGNYAYGPGGRTGVYRAGTVSVEAFDPNPWGLYHMHGNAWEWCVDVWSPDYADGPADQTPRHTGDARIRVLRGGSWLNGPSVLRAAQRLGDPAAFRHPTFGFRIARSLPPAPTRNA